MNQPANHGHTFLLCFDFDGTLAYPLHEPPFHPRTLEYLKALRYAGAAWVIISGRGLENLIRGFGENGLFILPDFIIANEYEIHMPDGTGGWAPFSEWNRQVNRDQYEFRHAHRQLLLNLQRWVQAEVKATMVEDEEGSWGAVAETIEEMDRICERIARLRYEAPDLGYQRNGRHIRFSHASYDKGRALAELQKLLDIQPDRTFTAGDNHNDLPMLDRRVARFRACPANAEEEVKRHLEKSAGYIAKAEASLGMMEAMRYFFQANLDELEITREGKDMAFSG